MKLNEIEEVAKAAVIEPRTPEDFARRETAREVLCVDLVHDLIAEVRRLNGVLDVMEGEKADMEDAINAGRSAIGRICDAVGVGPDDEDADWASREGVDLDMWAREVVRSISEMAGELAASPPSARCRRRRGMGGRCCFNGTREPGIWRQHHGR